MHLHQLKVRNLASLRGEHTIDFETLSGQDLFAITGETGAGKSTILNALSLALYGKVYKRQLIQSDLVTLGERDASIELNFSVRGVRHLAQWSTTVRKKDGSLLNHPRTERFFYQLAEGVEARVLDTGPEEILSLDFDQFSKCVVLNQGEFARFLTASFAERRDILEHLYPSDNLEAVGGLAKRKFEGMQEKLQRLDVQVHGLNEETLFDVEAARQTELKWQKAHETTQEKLKTLRPWAQAILDLKTYAQKHREAQEKLAGQQATLKTRTDEYNLTMTAWRTHQAEAENFEARLEKERPAHEAMDAEARALQVALTTWTEQNKKKTEDAARLGREERRHQQLAEDVTSATAALQKLALERHWKTAGDLESIDWPAWEKFQRETPLLEQQQSQLQETLKTMTEKGRELAAEEGKLQAERTKLLAKLPASLQSLSASARSLSLKESRDTLTRAGLTQAEALKLTAEIKTLSEERASLVPQLRELALLVENEALKHALHMLQSQLADRATPKDCPLCAQGINPTKWENLKETWLRPQTETSSQEQLLKLQKHDERLETKLQDLQKRLSGLPVLGQTLTATELKQQEETHEALTRLETQAQHFEKQLQDSRAQWKTTQDKLTALEAQVQTHLKARSELVTLTGKTLSAPLEWTPGLLKQLAQERDVFRQQKDKERALQTLKQQDTQLIQDILALKTSLTDLTQWVTTTQTSLDERQQKLNAQYPGTTPQVVLKALNDDLRARLARGQVLQQENRQKESLLSEARSQLGRIEEQLSTVAVLYADLITRMHQTRPITVSIQDAETVLTPLLQEVEAEIKTHETLASEADSERGKIKTLLAEDEKRREKKALFEKQQAEAKTEAHRWKRILDVLGQDDMRTFVLSLVEAALIQQTNFELEKLCSGRYEIQHNAKKGKLVPEFWVIDRWRDGLLRKVTTLSGGETFMVSLAMALALAEMARGRADIDCFFIDEGFGTLDEDSLEDVMEMLHQVRSRGKQIGLITHVKALSQRLPINLKVTKDARGNSSVGVVWN